MAGKGVFQTEVQCLLMHIPSGPEKSISNFVHVMFGTSALEAALFTKQQESIELLPELYIRIPAAEVCARQSDQADKEWAVMLFEDSLFFDPGKVELKFKTHYLSMDNAPGLPTEINAAKKVMELKVKKWMQEMHAVLENFASAPNE